MAQLYLVPTNNNLQYTLNTQLPAGGTTMTLSATVTGVVQAPGVCVVDRVDANGNKTASVREYISFTGVSGAQLTGLTKGLAGSTDQVHNVGAIVEFVPDIVQEAAWFNVFTTEHTVGGNHGSLPSTVYLRALNLAVPSQASAQLINVNNLVSASQASLSLVNIGSLMNASGASLVGNFPIVPVWVLTGTLSGATTAIGRPLDMPQSGTIQWASIVTRTPVSTASLVVDINKNFSSIFTDQNTRISILGSGTFASTASIGAKTFKQGDVFTVDVAAGGNVTDATVKFFAQ